MIARIKLSKPLEAWESRYSMARSDSLHDNANGFTRECELMRFRHDVPGMTRSDGASGGEAGERVGG